MSLYLQFLNRCTYTVCVMTLCLNVRTVSCALSCSVPFVLPMIAGSIVVRCYRGIAHVSANVDPPCM